jgi:hypothetical protein
MKAQSVNSASRAAKPSPITTNGNTGTGKPVVVGQPKLAPISSGKPPQTYTYLTTKELAERLRYSVIAVRTCLMDSVLIEGVHYVRPFGGRKILFLWEVIEADMLKASGNTPFGRF